MSPQRKQGNPAAPARKGAAHAAARAVERSERRRRLGLIGFGALLIALFVIVAVAQGIGHPEPSGDEIAVIEDAGSGGSTAAVTKEQFDRALAQTALRNGLKQVPATDDPQYQQVKDFAIDDQILTQWVLGEAAERGIEVTDSEIDDQLQQVKEQQFGCKPDAETCAAFEKGIKQSGFTEDEVRERIRLQVISDQIQRDVLPDKPPVSDDEIQSFYDANQDQFQTPESRDVRVVLTKTESDAAQAKQELGTGPTPEDWKAVAKKYSTDEATKDSGGLRQQVIQGQSEPALDQQIFASPEGEVVGPFKADQGYYVIEVEKVNPAETTPLDQATDTIRRTLASAKQNQIVQNFQQDFSTKWRARTFCADGYLIDRCSNAEPAANQCTEERANSTGCGAAVPSRPVISPGSAVPFGGTAATPLPQGPITPQAAGAPQNAVPSGLQQLPPGTAPPGTAPPGTAPPGTAPPGG